MLQLLLLVVLLTPPTLVCYALATNGCLPGNAAVQRGFSGAIETGLQRLSYEAQVADREDSESPRTEPLSQASGPLYRWTA